MKHLLIMLIEKWDPDWWRLRSSTGDPPEEREGHYTMTGLKRMLLTKLKQAEKEHEINS